MINKEKKLKAFERALDVMDRLRAECPWNHAQTIDTLRPMTVEEVYELSDAVMKKDDAALEKELGDVFLHVIFYAKIAEEEGRYDIADVMDKLCEKMIYRHPHVFSTTKVADAEQVSENWEMLKAKEKGGNKRILSGIPDASDPEGVLDAGQGPRSRFRLGGEEPGLGQGQGGADGTSGRDGRNGFRHY